MHSTANRSRYDHSTTCDEILAYLLPRVKKVVFIDVSYSLFVSRIMYNCSIIFFQKFGGKMAHGPRTEEPFFLGGG